MWLVLCDSTDSAARWACEGLRYRGLEPVELITSDDLAHARWVHYVGCKGASVKVELRDGRTLVGEQVTGTLNRLVYPPHGDLLLIHPSDRDYVLQELTAFFLSWLHSLPGPMLNRPTPQTLCGRPRSLVEWLWLAQKAGLPVRPYRQSNQDTVGWHGLHVRLPDAGPDLRTLVVVGESVVGEPAPPPIEEGCRRLGVLSGTGVLGVEFSLGNSGAWEFAGATCLPDLRLGGNRLLDVLAGNLRDSGE